MHPIVRILLFPLLAIAAFAQPGSRLEPLREPNPQQKEIQRLYGPVGLALITPDIDPALIDQFKAKFGAEGKQPRLLLYVNRPLFEATQAAPEPAESPEGDSRKDAAAIGPEQPSLADRQTIREIEFLVGGVIRAFGGDLVDQTVALGSPSEASGSDSADLRREKLSTIADIAVEVLVSGRRQKIVAVSGDREIMVPDIQMTAIRLADSAIVGQSNAAGILAGLDSATLALVAADVRSVTEATAQQLVLDMIGVRPEASEQGGME